MNHDKSYINLKDLKQTRKELGITSEKVSDEGLRDLLKWTDKVSCAHAQGACS